jgi:hypothetical protein
MLLSALLQRGDLSDQRLEAQAEQQPSQQRTPACDENILLQLKGLPFHNNLEQVIKISRQYLFADFLDK